MYESYKSRYSFPKTGDVLISAAGTIGRAVVYDGKSAYFQDSNIVWLDNDESIVSNRYLWQCYKIVNWFVSGGGTIDRLYNDNIKKTKIPVPYPNNPEKSLTEQARIVAILDKFDALVNDLSSGLPAEIKARRQQYAHYRDKLLSFTEMEATA
ncbi:MAG: restriction endonuclease subunit S [Gammaproteobacteria bacterium]|nr:restriction endonuclease subunit S [Gammaproteobacteria bacterium]